MKRTTYVLHLCLLRSNHSIPTQLELKTDLKRHKTGESWTRMAPTKVAHLGIGEYNPAEGNSTLPSSPRRAPSSDEQKSQQRIVELSNQNRSLQTKNGALEVFEIILCMTSVG